MIRNLYNIASRAQFFIVPLLFFSCGRSSSVPDVIQYADSTASMVSYNHVMIYAGNGQKRYKMISPEIRRYEYASDPYTIYPHGLQILCYSDTVANKVIADLVADYAVLWENSNIWEAKGNIVGNNYLENKHFETDILFWDQDNALIYNDHYTKVQDGENWWTGYGFQTDDSFEVWRFNHSRGLMKVRGETPSDSVEQSQPMDTIPEGQEQLTRMERNELQKRESEKRQSKQSQIWEEVF